MALCVPVYTLQKNFSYLYLKMALQWETNNEAITLECIS